MPRKNNEDDARNYSIGDMKRDQEKIEVELTRSVNVGKDEDQARKTLRMMANVAKQEKDGALVELKKTRQGYVINVYHPKKK